MGHVVLPPPYSAEDADKVDDPKYCHYHRGIHHPTVRCHSLKNLIQKFIEKGVVRFRNDGNASANEITVKEEQSLHCTKAKARTQMEDDGSWELVCSKGLPDMHEPSQKRRSHKKREEAQKRQQELVDLVIPYSERIFRRSSRYQPFIVEDYLHHERLYPFSRRMREHGRLQNFLFSRQQKRYPNWTTLGGKLC